MTTNRNTLTRNRLTNNSDETDIGALISGDNIFSIPYFQRAYKWKPDRIKQLNMDMLNIVDGSVDCHFLGAIIVHGRRTNPSDPGVFDVIDGQQRITTLFLYLAGIVKTLVKQKEFSTASGIFLKYMLINRKTNLPSNLKLHSCKEDRTQLNYVINDICSNKKFLDEISIKINYLTPSGKDRGVLRNNYRAIIRFLDEQIEQGGLERLTAIYTAILESMSVVQIDVWDPTNGPKIYDSLNSKQEPMTIGDLVRNEIFRRVTNLPPNEIDIIDENHWQPFYKKFQQNGYNLFENYFFPFGLIQDANLKKSEVFTSLRDSWDHIKEPEAVISILENHQNAFIDIATGSNIQGHSTIVANKFKDLTFSNIPSSTYPFLMQLSNHFKNGDINENSVLKILLIIESFLVRRAVCGYEPTGLHAVFKRLWKDCKGKPTPALVIETVKRHKTVTWPNEEEFKKMITMRPLYGSSITKYLLYCYDKDLGGDIPSNIPWIEHVLPVKPDNSWNGIFTDQEHEAMKDVLANLIPLSKEMNRVLSNSSYVIKKKKYKEDSMFKSARVLAENHSEWNTESIESRSNKLAEWALKRWPH